jgi:hypothetical protein
MHGEIYNLNNREVISTITMIMLLASVISLVFANNEIDEDQVTLYNDSEFLENFEVAIYKRGRAVLYPKTGDMLLIHYTLRTTDEQVRELIMLDV